MMIKTTGHDCCYSELCIRQGFSAVCGTTSTTIQAGTFFSDWCEYEKEIRNSQTTERHYLFYTVGGPATPPMLF